MATERKQPQVLVVGAGAGGLGVAAELGRRGIAAQILERETLAASWRRRYPSLTLNNDRWSARLPRARIRAERWPARDDYIAHLERYAVEKGLSIRCGVDVQRIERAPEGWTAQTSAGRLTATDVVICTGRDRVPTVPPWSGQDVFKGKLMHAAEFQAATDFGGSDVLVVGVGTSATEIATRLARVAARVRVAVRTVPNFMPQEFLGLPITVWARLFQSAPADVVDRLGRLVQWLMLRDLDRLGLAPPPTGVASELLVKGMGPVIDRGFLDAVRSGSIELVGALNGFDEDGALLADGARIEPDVVIAATGYRSGLEQLTGHLDMLDADGEPLARGRGKPAAPGLYFHGYQLPLSGELSGMRRDARVIARRIASSARRGIVDLSDADEHSDAWRM